MESYKEIVKDYFREFKRGFRWEMAVHIVYISILVLQGYNSSGKYFDVRNCFLGIPIFFALFSGIFHTHSLPMMLYLVPCTKQMRENYIEKMFRVEIAVPMIVSLGVDVIFFLLRPSLVKNIILQLLSVFCLTFIIGTINDRQDLHSEKRAPYRDVSGLAGVVLVSSWMGAVVMYYICASELTTTAFFITLIVLSCLCIPVMVSLAKRFPSIKENCADYEMMTNAEVQNKK